jgi:putative endonuclease
MMIMSKKHNYYVYIMTNYSKTVLYIGVTNDLSRRVGEHNNGFVKGFTQRYKCYYLIYYECFTDVNMAIQREKELKGWTREKKEELINGFNPDREFLNETRKPVKP